MEAILFKFLIQADVGDGMCSNFPLWTSSTVPDCQIMKNTSQSDPSANEDVPFPRRQSTSELEGDVVIDGLLGFIVLTVDVVIPWFLSTPSNHELFSEIINQQFLSYARLSQAHSDVKMVQSLIPIWEVIFYFTRSVLIAYLT